jgi:hypothetical protein
MYRYIPATAEDADATRTIARNLISSLDVNNENDGCAVVWLPLPGVRLARLILHRLHRPCWLSSIEACFDQFAHSHSRVSDCYYMDMLDVID